LFYSQTRGERPARPVTEREKKRVSLGGRKGGFIKRKKSGSSTKSVRVTPLRKKNPSEKRGKGKKR